MQRIVTTIGFITLSLFIHLPGWCQDSTVIKPGYISQFDEKQLDDYRIVYDTIVTGYSGKVREQVKKDSANINTALHKWWYNDDDQITTEMQIVYGWTGYYIFYLYIDNGKLSYRYSTLFDSKGRNVADAKITPDKPPITIFHFYKD